MPVSANWLHRALCLIVTVLAVVMSFSARAQTDWSTFGFDAQRTGYNPNETALSAQNVSTLAPIWSKDIGGPILTQPTLLQGVATFRGSFDVLYAATLYGDVYAMYASTGATLWHQRVAAVQTYCDDFAQSGGYVGVIGTPTFDRANNRMFLVAGDGNLHALDIATGSELPGWPIQVVDLSNTGRLFVYGSPTYDANTSLLYIGLASACDFAPYHGQVVQVATGSSTPVVQARWLTTGENGPDGGGVWGPGGVSITSDGRNVFVLTGNTLVAPYRQPYAEYVVKLTQTLDIAAANWPHINGFDLDFGATPLLFQAPGCPPELAAMNKSGALFLYDRSSDATINAGPLQRIQITGTQYGASGNFVGVPAYDPGRQMIYLGSPSDAAATYTHGLIALNILPSCQASLAWQAQVGLNNVDYNNPAIPATVANGVVYLCRR